jgi:uncharacterized protein (DUF433 family)
MVAQPRDDMRYQPLYTPGDISRYAHVHPATLRNWTSGSDRALVPAGSGVAPFSFINLIEAHVLVALRKTHQVPMQQIRKELRKLRRRFETDHPLAEWDVETDGYGLYIEYLGIKQTASGQSAIPEVVSLYLQRIDREAIGPVRLYPFTTWEKCPKLIAMDPLIDFGRPVIAGTRIETTIIRERFNAGEGVVFLAGDYDVSTVAIEEALRCEPEGRAA